MDTVLAAATSILVGALAFAMGWITLPASLWVACMGFVVIWRLGWFWAFPPVIFLGVGSILSRKREKRNAFQVIANGGVATLFAFLGDPGAYTVALTVGFSDTVATEVGMRLSPKAFLITNLKEVQRGTSGGVSLEGTLAGFVAILLMSVFLIASGKGNLTTFYVASSIGLFSDSLVGATLESRGYFNNDMTNFSATLVGAMLYVLLNTLTSLLR